MKVDKSKNLDIGSTPVVPAQQGTDSERMPKAMQVRPPDTRGHRELKCGKKLVECPTDRVGADRPSFSPIERESGALGRHRSELPFFTLQVRREGAPHLRSEWHQAVLAELRLSDDRQLAVEIDVSAAQSRHFSDAKSETVQHCEDHPVDLSTILRAGIAGQFVGEFEQTARLIGLKRNGRADGVRRADFRSARATPTGPHGPPSNPGVLECANEAVVAAGRSRGREAMNPSTSVDVICRSFGTPRARK